jgi:hypothetical protein
MKDLTKQSLEKEYQYEVNQSVRAYFKGKITVKATSEEEVTEIIQKMSQGELEQNVSNGDGWELTNPEPDDNIHVAWGSGTINGEPIHSFRRSVKKPPTNEFFSTSGNNSLKVNQGSTYTVSYTGNGTPIFGDGSANKIGELQEAEKNSLFDSEMDILLGVDDPSKTVILKSMPTSEPFSSLDGYTKSVYGIDSSNLTSHNDQKEVSKEELIGFLNEEQSESKEETDDDW